MIREKFTRMALGFVAITLSILIGVGCAAPTTQEGVTQQAEEPQTKAEETQKTTLTICLGGETTTLNKNIGQGGGGALGITIYEALFNNLVRPDPGTGEVVPELATEWEVLDDQVTWQFKLREGVKFHNGTELTAEDVKVTLDDVLTSETAVSNVKRRTQSIDRVEVVDDYTVNIITKEPFVTLPVSVGDAAIYPAEYYQEVGADGFSEAPIGSGQFKFKEWIKGTRIVLEDNPDYWGPKTSIDEVVFRPFPESGARIAALERGECDIASNVPPDEAERLESEGFEVKWSPLGQSMLVQLVPEEGTALESQEVRQALNYAVDKETLVESVMLGFGAVLDGQLVGPDGFGYNPDLEPYPYDPARAQEMLANAGYPNGFSVGFSCSQGRYAKQKEMCEALVGQLSQVGVELDLQMREWGTFLNQIVTASPERPPTWYIGLNYYPAMDAEFIIQHYITDSPLQQFSHPELDRLYEQQKQEFDPDKRQEIIQEFMAVVREEAPNIFLFQAPDIYGVNQRVQGYEPTPDNYIHLENVSIQE